MVSHVIWNAIFRSNYDIPEIALSGRAALWVVRGPPSGYTFCTLLLHFLYTFLYTCGALLLHFWYTFGTLPCGYLKVFLRVLEGIPMIVEGPNSSKGDPCG
jgi:hypothetical protein